MQIGSLQSSPMSPFSGGARTEAAERGPDRDNDGDEGGATLTAVAAKTASALAPSGRGQKVNILA